MTASGTPVCPPFNEPRRLDQFRERRVDETPPERCRGTASSKPPRTLAGSSKKPPPRVESPAPHSSSGAFCVLTLTGFSNTRSRLAKLQRVLSQVAR